MDNLNSVSALVINGHTYELNIKEVAATPMKTPLKLPNDYEKNSPRVWRAEVVKFKDVEYSLSAYEFAYYVTMLTGEIKQKSEMKHEDAKDLFTPKVLGDILESRGEPNPFIVNLAEPEHKYAVMDEYGRPVFLLTKEQLDKIDDYEFTDIDNFLDAVGLPCTYSINTQEYNPASSSDLQSFTNKMEIELVDNYSIDRVFKIENLLFVI